MSGGCYSFLTRCWFALMTLRIIRLSLRNTGCFFPAAMQQTSDAAAFEGAFLILLWCGVFEGALCVRECVCQGGCVF